MKDPTFKVMIHYMVFLWETIGLLYIRYVNLALHKQRIF